MEIVQPSVNSKKKREREKKKTPVSGPLKTLLGEKLFNKIQLSTAERNEIKPGNIRWYVPTGSRSAECEIEGKTTNLQKKNSRIPN